MIFIASIVVSVGLSSLVCIYDSLINNHFLGILFLLILNGVNDFSLIYAKHKIVGGFDEAFAVLLTLLGGTSGIILAVQISKKDFQNSFNYLDENLVLACEERSFERLHDVLAAKAALNVSGMQFGDALHDEIKKLVKE